MTTISVNVVDGNELVEKNNLNVEVEEGQHIEILRDGVLEEIFRGEHSNS